MSICFSDSNTVLGFHMYAELIGTCFQSSFPDVRTRINDFRFTKFTYFKNLKFLIIIRYSFNIYFGQDLN